MSTKEVERRLSYLFRGVGLAAALSEVRTAQQYPVYLDEIVQSTGLPPDLAMLVWGIRRGSLWEPL
jgi:hypothetical protein